MPFRCAYSGRGENYRLASAFEIEGIDASVVALPWCEPRHAEAGRTCTHIRPKVLRVSFPNLQQERLRKTPVETLGAAHRERSRRNVVHGTVVDLVWAT